LQITSRCNMKCGHCCMSCEPGKGEDMSMKIVRAALAMDNYSITIGGGEPTMHPLFEKILLETIAVPKMDSDCGLIVVITNGTHKKRSLMLVELCRNNVILADLSTDYYHDREMVSDEVYEAFGSLDDGYRDVTKNGSREPEPVGRYLETLGLDWEDIEQKKCSCDSLIVEPNGDVHQCGCPDAPLVGNVLTGIDMSLDGMCFHSAEYEHKMEERDD